MSPDVTANAEVSRGVPAESRSLTNSQAWLARARRTIPSCSQTFSKAPTQFVQGVAPAFLQRGKGAHVWDVDGNEYLDYSMALGPIILGHAHPAVTEAVSRQAAEATVLSLPHPLEVEVAETLVDCIPCAEMVRFAKNGSDATAGAVRLARAYTGRDVIACCGYHGWQDWYIGTTTRHRGIPQAVRDLTVGFEYNNLESLKRVLEANQNRVAAVILEPVGIVEPQRGFLEGVREFVHAAGALLIFDEVVTGFRLAIGGAQEYFGITPDLACVGKAMGNGYPIAALVGRRDVMAMLDEVFFSFTFGGETIGLAAAKATIAELREREVISHLWNMGQLLKSGFNALAAEIGAPFAQCVGYAPRTVITFSPVNDLSPHALKTFFQQECLKRGILFTAAHNVCFAHSRDDITYTLEVYGTVLRLLKSAIETGDVLARLEGNVVEPVFRRP